MNKRLLLSIPLCMAAVCASAQVQLRDADLMRIGELRTSLRSSSMLKETTARGNGSRVQIIIRYDSENALNEIRAKGGEIVSLVGTRTAIVSVDAANAQAVAASRGVTGARLSTLMKRSNDKALSFSNIPDVHSGKNLESSFKGKGVVIGLFDTGIDPNHINFRAADGSNRISCVYEYLEDSAIPEIYNTPAQISTFTCDTRQESHGTHVLGIMAGSFIDTYEPGAPDYCGVAPEAEIVACCGPGYNAQILDAMERIGKYAREQGKPCVMNLSFGDNLGPHDGSDEFTEAINDIAEKYDAVICLAGGNERDEPIAIVKALTESDPYLRTLTLKPETDQNDIQSFGAIEIWANDGAPFEVSLDIISKSKPNVPEYSLVIPEKKSTYVAQGSMINDYFYPSDIRRMDIVSSGTPFQTYYSNSFMGGVKGLDPYNKRYNAQLNLYLTSAASYGNKYFVRLNIKGNPGQKIFVFCDGTYMNFGNRNIPGLEVPDGYGTNSNMACGPYTFAVGSYVTAHRPASGYPNGTIGDLSYFSSFGETLDGRQMPEICAPGQVIISSRNSYAATSGSMAYYYPLEYSYRDINDKQTYYWTSCAGTSQSSPHMAGVAALWRGANPNLSLSDIKRIALETAAAPSFSSLGWGAGKVDALAGIKAALGSSSVYDIMENAPESIMVDREGDLFNIYAPGQNSLKVEIYSLQGTKIAEESALSESLVLNLSNFSAGVYAMKVSGSHTSRTLKIRK